jgi:hypothetical protein
MIPRRHSAKPLTASLGQQLHGAAIHGRPYAQLGGIWQIVSNSGKPAFSKVAEPDMAVEMIRDLVSNVPITHYYSRTFPLDCDLGGLNLTLTLSSSPSESDPHASLSPARPPHTRRGRPNEM